MNIIRGIIVVTENGRMLVDSPGHLYNLNTNEPYTQRLKKDDRLLGVILNDIFNICYEFNSNSENKIFGYIVESSNEKIIKIQQIDAFNKETFNPFDPSYNLGEIKSINGRNDFFHSLTLLSY